MLPHGQRMAQTNGGSVELSQVAYQRFKGRTSRPHEREGIPLLGECEQGRGELLDQDWLAADMVKEAVHVQAKSLAMSLAEFPYLRERLFCFRARSPNGQMGQVQQCSSHGAPGHSPVSQLGSGLGSCASINRS
jgi:hypothetical protein